MHWTLATLLVLCGLCSALNIEQWVTTHSIRTAGVLVCAGWLVQQTYWAATGSDSLALFIVCDGAIIAWFLAGYFLLRREFDIAERMIAATIPLTTALGIYAWMRGGHTPESWWANWWLVAGQMLIGLPSLGVIAIMSRLLARWKANFRHRKEWTDLEHRGTNG